MVKVIGISGRKQSGKNTAANYIAGSILKSKNMIQDFVITEVGSLSIKTTDGDGNVGWGIFDLTEKIKRLRPMQNKRFGLLLKYIILLIHSSQWL